MTREKERPALPSAWLPGRAWALAEARVGVARITEAIPVRVMVLGARQQWGAVVCRQIGGLF